MINLLEFAAVWERALFVALAATNAWGVPGSAHVRTDVVQPHENKQNLILLSLFHMTRRAGLKHRDVWFSQTISPAAVFSHPTGNGAWRRRHGSYN
ncbi:hypothetical protein [Burkholderia ubonensis]|uniref:hypothetical protein n=1 Tax=Burkholderia ubonensis TaxID=101571 RepID=UPI0012F88ED4|nr:hypothetical protein [Burkholderia ubonensis]